MVVYVVYKIVSSYSGYKVGRNAAILTALFPVLILQTIILSREIFITFFVSSACLYLVMFSKSSKYKYFIYAVFCILIASAPHTGILISVILALLVTFIYTLWSKAKSMYLVGAQTSFSKKGILASFSVATISCTAIVSFQGLADPLSGAKIFSLLSADQPLDPVYARYDTYSGGAADFPRWISPASPLLMILFIPLRAIYFLFSPFVWMVSEIRHLFGFVNALVILFLTYNATFLFEAKGRRYGTSLIFIFLLVISFVIVFSIATNNFGQAFRHRAKILPLLISFGIIGYNSQRN
ncbi:hypothetical protein GGP96_002107 [Salinibacter ruber]|nr:hypothetical protein [Salinibacter ruber]